MPLAQGLQHIQQGDAVRHAVGRRVDADDGVAAPQQQPIDRGGADAAQIIGRVVGLQPGPEMPSKALGIPKRGHHPALAGDADQILVAHQFGGGGGDLGRDSRSDFGKTRRGGVVGQQPVAEAAYGQMGYCCERRVVVGIDDQPRHLIGLIGNDRFVKYGGQGQVGEDRACGDPLGIACRRDASQFVAGSAVRRPRQNVFEIGKPVPLPLEVADVGGHLISPDRPPGMVVPVRSPVRHAARDRRGTAQPQSGRSSADRRHAGPSAPKSPAAASG